MFQFLFGVAFGAAAYWAWQSFGRDLLGMGGDSGETTYGGFSAPSGTSSFGSTPTSSIGTSGDGSTSPAGSTSSGSTPSGNT
jgi:hypothetical protein